MSKSQLSEHRFSIVHLIICIIVLFFVVVSVAIPSSYYFLQKNYAQGIVESESDANAYFITLLLDKNPHWDLTHPSLKKFAQEDVVFDENEEFLESREILSNQGKAIFSSDYVKELQGPIISKQSLIIRNNKQIGFFKVGRSMAGVVKQTMLLAGFIIFLSIISLFLLYQFVLKRLFEIEKEIAFHASYDALTKLPNRNEALKEIKRRLQCKNNQMTAIIFIDLDKFKSVNDAYGHEVGDDVLKLTGARVASVIRQSDFLGRLAGDEFIVAVDLDGSSHLLNSTLEAICNAFEQPFICHELELFLSVSMGVAMAPKNGVSAEDLIRHSDTAMYSCKSNREEKWLYYESAMSELIEKELVLRKKLKFALTENQFELHYQAIFDVDTQHIIGAEALIRWRDPETAELIAPNLFIPELENSGLIVPVGEWVLRSACQQVAIWRKTLPHFKLAINVSARQFNEDVFVGTVEKILSETGVCADAIELELTESMLHNEALTTKRLAELKVIGVQLSLDDFGTGYSSFGRLASMPFDVIKIDRSFIHHMTASEKEFSIVVSIVALAKELGITVLAEGIESDIQLTLLKNLECQRGQGFWFARPISSDAFTQLIAPSS